MQQILALDEPTNHLDMETIDSLARAINTWDGGMVLVSHDFRLISQARAPPPGCTRHALRCCIPCTVRAARRV